MYTVKPKGINIRQNERNVPDGFLQESINLQWRDGVYRPIPERLFSGILNTSDKDEIILHKVSDEDKINVLMFDSSVLKWFGTIENGVYTEKITPESIHNFPIVSDFSTLSFIILNGIIYFMNSTDKFYYNVQFDEVKNTYESTDMYSWKNLQPAFYTNNIIIGVSGGDGNDYRLLTRCGVVLIRYALELKTGEVILPSTIFVHSIYGYNSVNNGSAVVKDDLIENIHSYIGINLDGFDTEIDNDDISAVNVYATIPVYKTQFNEGPSYEATSQLKAGIHEAYSNSEMKSDIQRLSDENFYLIKTVGSKDLGSRYGSVQKSIFLYVESKIGAYNLLKEQNSEYSVNASTIAAGEVMPIDNFSYHKLYGNLTSYNGRLSVNKPTTVLSNGYVSTIGLNSSFPSQGREGYDVETEDGSIKVGMSVSSLNPTKETGELRFRTRGVIAYPDQRASKALFNIFDNTSYLPPTSDQFLSIELKKLETKNLSCNLDFYDIDDKFSLNNIEFDGNETTTFTITYGVELIYNYLSIQEREFNSESLYNSQNRLQFSESGEFSVWPAINSYRVGEGKIQFVGSNSVDPANNDFLAPLLIGTSDGVYTVNFDPSGISFIQSITKAANMPALSSENIQIDQNLIYISDKGLIVINNGQLDNLTKNYFPEQGNGNFPDANIVYPNYDILTNEFFGGANPYIISDIVDYMKGAIFAYDGRRNNIWCSNALKNFSLIYNLFTGQWDVSTYVFTKAVDFLSIINTVEGEIYSRFLVLNNDEELDVLSGEDPSQEVETHLLTRPIKIQTPDQYKKIQRLISRCELYRERGYFTFGLWGKQDLNKDKINIPLIAYKDNSTEAFPNNIRQDIPVGMQKGKYKTITILQGGKLLPNSSLSGFEIVAIPIDNNILR